MTRVTARARGDRRVIPLARPDIGPREEELVLEVLRSGHALAGPGRAAASRRSFAAYVGTRHAAAVSSGTAGLHLAVRLAGVGPGDEVITSPFSFVASANCALYEGATPVFADIDPVTFNIDPAAVEAAITPRTRAIVPVHVFGLPCDIEAINEIARKHDLAVIEDAAEAIGARRRGRLIGTHGNPAVFAFYPNKQMTTGEGGMVDDRRPGAARRPEEPLQPGPLRHRRLARARPARLQLPPRRRVGGDRRRAGRAPRRASSPPRGAVAARYDALLGDIEGVSTPAVVEGDERSWFVYVVELHPQADRNAVMARLQDVRRGLQAVPAGDPPAAVLPRARASRGRAAGLRVGLGAHAGAAVLRRDHRGRAARPSRRQLEAAVEASWRS